MAENLPAPSTALLHLLRGLTAESSGTVFADALAELLGATRLSVAFAFALDDTLHEVAALARPPEVVSPALGEVALGLAQRVIASGCLSLVADLADVSWDPGSIELHPGCEPAALAVSILHQSAPLGALVFVALDRREIDPECRSFLETGTLALALAVHRDRHLEQDKAQQAELLEAGRMASLGLLTASVAHELRGPVGALVLQMEEQRRLLQSLVLGAQQRAPLGPALVAELGELTQDIDTAIDRVRATVEQLSQLSRRDLEPELLDLAEVTKEALSVASPHLRRRGIALELHLDPGAKTRGRRDNLAQVVLNLVLNAVDACEQGAPAKRISVSVRPGREHVVLQVNDTGPGVPQNAIKTIFKAFFTTKKRGQGTGLGLKICSDVVTAHGGHIEVFNRAEGGASFRVLLPRADGRRRPAPSGEKRPTSRPRPFKILIIDDDPVFTRTVRRALKAYDIRTAEAAADAEVALADPSYQPDLVLCDVFLPGINGDQLHSRVKKQDPDLAQRFVFVTGGALSEDEADYLRGSGCPTLYKPINVDDIVQIVEHDTPAESNRQLFTLVRA